MEISLATIITTALTAGVIGAIGLLLNQRSQLVRIETLLTGADGSNGLVDDVKQLRAKSHKHSDELHAVSGRVELVTLRLEAVERRDDVPGRRASDFR